MILIYYSIQFVYVIVYTLVIFNLEKKHYVLIV